MLLILSRLLKKNITVSFCLLVYLLRFLTISAIAIANMNIGRIIHVGNSGTVGVGVGFMVGVGVAVGD